MLDKIQMTLTRIQSESCEGPLTIEECFSALEGMARNKTPGSDGLPAEFYLKFWDVIGSFGVASPYSCVNGIVCSHKLSGTCTLSSTTLGVL